MRFSYSIGAQAISAIAQTLTFFVTVPGRLAIPSFPTRHPVAKVYLVGGPCVPLLPPPPSIPLPSFLLSSQFIRRPRFRFVFLSYLAVQRSYSSSAAADADP